MSARFRPRRCSRVRYATTCSSFVERVKRKEKGLRRTLPRLSTAGSYRPFQICIRNRIAVRIVRREAERAVDPRLQLLREDMFEPVGLVVDVVDVDTERLGEIELEEPVVADHLERDALAGGRQRAAAVRRVLGEAERGELLHHRRR